MDQTSVKRPLQKTTWSEVSTAHWNIIVVLPPVFHSYFLKGVKKMLMLQIEIQNIQGLLKRMSNIKHSCLVSVLVNWMVFFRFKKKTSRPILSMRRHLNYKKWCLKVKNLRLLRIWPLFLTGYGLWDVRRYSLTPSRIKTDLGKH